MDGGRRQHYPPNENIIVNDKDKATTQIDGPLNKNEANSNKNNKTNFSDSPALSVPAAHHHYHHTNTTPKIPRLMMIIHHPQLPRVV